MFAGIGGFRTGLTRAGGFRCVGHCEIDKYANASYEAIYELGKEERYYHDATKIDPADLPDFDLLCGGFPCQTFSIAGRRKGFENDFHPVERSGIAIYQGASELYPGAAKAEYPDGRRAEQSRTAFFEGQEPASA